MNRPLMKGNFNVTNLLFFSFTFISRMFFVSTLPELLTVVILSDWSELNEIRELDSAVCNKIGRIDFLSIIRSDVFVLKTKPPKFDETEVEMSYSVEQMRWISTKQLKLLHFNFIGDNFTEESPLNFNIDTSKLESMTISSCIADQLSSLRLAEFIGSC